MVGVTKLSGIASSINDDANSLSMQDGGSQSSPCKFGPPPTPRPDVDLLLAAPMPCYAAYAMTSATMPTASDYAMIVTTAVRTSVERASGSGVSIALPSFAPTMRDPLARTVSTSMCPTGAGNGAGHERKQLGTAADHDLRAWRRKGEGVIPADWATRSPATGRVDLAGTPTGPFHRVMPPTPLLTKPLPAWWNAVQISRHILAQPAPAPTTLQLQILSLKPFFLGGGCSAKFPRDVFTSASCVPPRFTGPGETVESRWKSFMNRITKSGKTRQDEYIIQIPWVEI